MAVIRGYIAVSLDGYIASPDGTLGWLTKYDGMDAGDFAYDRFIAGIRTVVMGRATYDAVAGFQVGWPYADKRTFVMTSRPIDDPLGPLQTWTRGVDALIAHLRTLDDGDVWMIGGGQLQQAFIQRGALDTLVLFIVPEIIGSGIPLFPPNDFARSVSLVSAEALNLGCVRLLYEFGSTPAK